jgi:putative addiction module antidote
MKTKLRKIGNSYGIILSQEAVDKLAVKEGEALYLTEAPDDRLVLSKRDEEYERQMAIAKSCMDRYSNTLRELAK